MSVTFFGRNIIIVTKIKKFILNLEFFKNLKQHDNNYLKSLLTIFLSYIFLLYIPFANVNLLLQYLLYCTLYSTRVYNKKSNYRV